MQSTPEKELEYLSTEWKETRLSIDRFDKISVDIRKFGFSLITSLITVSGIAFEITYSISVYPLLVASAAIMVLISGLFLIDRYNEVLLLAAVLRSRQLEIASHELFDNHMNNKIYLSLSLTTFLETKIQKTHARMFLFGVYILFIIASFLLSLFSIIAYYDRLSQPINWLTVTFSGALFLFFVYLLHMINQTMSHLIEGIESEEILANGEVVKKIFRKDQIMKAINQIAQLVNDHYKSRDFVMLTVGIGGLNFSQKLLSELKKLGRENIELVSAFTQKKFDEEGNITGIDLKTPDESKLRGRDVLIVDDLVATGHTLNELRTTCIELKARNIQSCIMLDAPAQRIDKFIKIPIEFFGLQTEEKGEFVGFGFGREWNGRDLPYIGVKIVHRHNNSKNKEAHYAN